MDGAFSTWVAQKNPGIVVLFRRDSMRRLDMPAIFTDESLSFSRFVFDTLCFSHHRHVKVPSPPPRGEMHTCMKRAAGQNRPMVIATDDIPFGAYL